MPPRPGESTLCTFFADVNYLISSPGHRPPHHRLEKASYFYLYHSVSNVPRIEIANNPGTPYQDALTGSLAATSIAHKPSQPNLVSLTVVRQPQQGHQDADAAWQLKAHDPSQRAEYIYPLHSVDVYFWTALDAESFVDKAKELGVGDLGGPYQQAQHQQQQQQSLINNNPRNSTTMSPVVQKLEQAAITPAYNPSHQQNASTSKAGVSPIAQPTPQHPQQQGHASPPPPSQAAGGTSSANAFAPPPMAYNPAAPAAPEPIAHREKTPPPADTGSTVAVQDVSSGQGYPYGQQGGFAQHQQIPNYGSSGPPPPPPPPPTGQAQQGSYMGQVGYASPPPQQQSFSPTPVPIPGSFPASSPPPPSNANGNNSLYSAPTPPLSAHNSMLAGYPQQAQQQPQRQSPLPFQQYAGSPPPQQPAQAGTGYQSPMQSPTFPPQPHAQAHAQPTTSPQPQTQPQPGPYTHQYSPLPHMHQAQQSSSSYSHPQPQPQAGTGAHPTPTQIHSQHYTPTSAETSATGGHSQTATNAAPQGRFDARTEKLEKGVGRFLKRLDKKF